MHIFFGSWKFEAAADCRLHSSFPGTDALTAELAGIYERGGRWLDAWLGQIFEDWMRDTFGSQNIFPVKATCIQQKKADVRSAVMNAAAEDATSVSTAATYAAAENAATENAAAMNAAATVDAAARMQQQWMQQQWMRGGGEVESHDCSMDYSQ